MALVASASGYRLGDFLDAARALRLEVVLATDAAPPAPTLGPHRVLTVDLSRIDEAAAAIARTEPEAIVPVEDVGVRVAAAAAALLGLPANPPEAAAAARDKLLARRRLAAGGIHQPEFLPVPPGGLGAVAARLGGPIVVKPRRLSGGRGVLRLETAADADVVEERIRRIVADEGGDPTEDLVAERYVPGPELAVEGVLRRGELEVLATIDVPDASSGPTFEETFLIAPSRLPDAALDAAIATLSDAVAALGLVEGPIHAELRLAETPMILEIAARPIGGRCGRAFRFGLLGESLETTLLRAALDLPGPAASLVGAAGIFMVPVARPGRFVGLRNLEAALAVPGVTEIEVAVPPGRRVRPLPEDGRYLGFVFAAGDDPAFVEEALRTAASLLEVEIHERAEGADPGPAPSAPT